MTRIQYFERTTCGIECGPLEVRIGSKTGAHACHAAARKPSNADRPACAAVLGDRAGSGGWGLLSDLVRRPAGRRW
jgi:hypothetical protein